ncbi:hypothetical protein [Devosia rhizoryzae]|uniref:Uncharacterized protein n=1 Tax=Devosia rhizoryzae TaxID=2774137 RepID=A0ABX7C591_9HYPH|nr:hypothetical protein [Devosia rhizoryzae]QQR37917.1 hypothetical protein JI748_08860 [Devosia rhizoryzae]
MTFGNALVSIAEAIRAINHEVNPGYSLEVAIEAVGPGSFRARLKTEKRSLLNLFSGQTARDLVIALLATFLWEKVIDPDTPPVITVNSDYVIIEHGSDRIIVPKEAFDHKAEVERSPAVNRHVSKTMEVLEHDPSVTSLGIARNLTDPEPVLDIPRGLFPIIRQNSVPATDDGRRSQEHNAILSVHKAVFERSSRKWEFVWNGFRISAPVLDQTFFDRLENRQLSLRQGDAFRAVLRVNQVYDRLSETWLNESYEVVTVGELVSRKPGQMESDLG